MKSAHGLNIPKTLEEVCDPQRVALLVYDMQVGILSQIKNPEEIMLQVLKVLSAARHAGVRVLFSRHLPLPKELMGMARFRFARLWRQRLHHCRRSDRDRDRTDSAPRSRFRIHSGTHHGCLRLWQ